MPSYLRSSAQVSCTAPPGIFFALCDSGELEFSYVLCRLFDVSGTDDCPRWDSGRVVCIRITMHTLIPQPRTYVGRILASGLLGDTREEGQPSGLPTLAASSTVSFVAARGHLQALESANETSVRR